MRRVWRTPSGLRLFSVVNNSYIGIFYVATAFLFFVLAGVLALIMRTQLAVPDNTLVGPSLYSQLFTMHGTVMMFLFAVPAVEAMAVLLLPNMLAARDLPFPRLSAYAFWAYCFGGLAFFASIFFGLAPTGGWFMYPPLTDAKFSPGINEDFWLLGIGFIEISAIAGAIEIIVGVLRTRAPGMTLDKLPVFAWAMLVFAGMIVFAFPAIIVATAMLELERAFGWPFFAAERGGDPLLWQHLFWFFGHPDVYIIFLPAAGMVSTIVATMARTPLVGYRLIVLAMLGTGFLGSGCGSTTCFRPASITWRSGSSPPRAWRWRFRRHPGLLVDRDAGRGRRAVAHADALPPGLPVHLRARRPDRRHGRGGALRRAGARHLLHRRAPALRADRRHGVSAVRGSLLLDSLRQQAGAVRARRPLGVRAHVRRREHCVLSDAHHGPRRHAAPRLHVSRRARLGHAEPRLDDRRLHGRGGCRVVHCRLAAQLPLYGGSTRGQRVAGRYAGVAADRDLRIRSIPEVKSREPLWDHPSLSEEVEAGAHYLPGAPTGGLETIVGTALESEPQYVLQLTGPSWMPIGAAAFTAAFFLLLTVKLPLPAYVCGVVAFVMILRWMWDTDPGPSHPPVDIGAGIKLPVYMAGPASHSWWATVVLLLVAAATYGSIVFSYLFLWMGSPQLWPAPDATPAPGYPLASAALLAVAAAAIAFASRALDADARRAMAIALVVAMLAPVRGVRARSLLGPRQAISPRDSSYGAIVFALVATQGLYAVLVTVMIFYTLARAWAKRLDRVRRATFDNTSAHRLLHRCARPGGTRARARLSAMGGLALASALDVAGVRVLPARSSGPCTSRRSTAMTSLLCARGRGGAVARLRCRGLGGRSPSTRWRWRPDRRLRRRAQAPRKRISAWITAGIAALAALAIVWEALPALLVPACE